jgi:hypothetical protein
MYFEDAERALNADLGPKDIFSIVEGLSKIGFWFQIKAAVSFAPEEY